MDVLPRQRRRHGLAVEPQRDAPRGLVHVCAPVVEEAESAVRLAAGVVLEGEPGAWPHREVAPLAAEAPDHLARLAVDLVDGGRPAGGDEQVVVRVHVHRVHVEVVVRVLEVGPHLGKGLVEPDVVQAVPLEEDLARLHVDLLYDAFQRDAVPRTADGGEVPRGLSVNDEQRGAAVGQEELVVVSLVTVTRAHAGDLPVGAVADDVLAPAVAPVNPLPPGEDGLSFVGLRLEVHRVPLLLAHGTQPDRVSLSVEDHGPVLGGMRLPGTVLGRHEDVARGHAARPCRHLDDWRPQVRA